MVMHKMQPHNRECNAIGRPKKTAQIRFNKKLPSPPPYVTSFPNGKRARPANLKHCIPTGIPTMVMHQMHPASRYPSALTRPPQSIHIIFPRQPIKFKSFLRRNVEKLFYDHWDDPLELKKLFLFPAFNLRREYTLFQRKSRGMEYPKR